MRSRGIAILLFAGLAYGAIACTSALPASSPTAAQLTESTATHSTDASEQPPVVLATPAGAPTSPATRVPPTQAPNTAEYTWTKLDAQNTPPARYDHALAFNTDEQELVLFGGRNGSQIFGDTWIYSTANNTWREIKTPGPSARFGMGAVYDPVRRTVLLFGGQQKAFYNDTWAFDTQSETWSEIQTEGDTPDIRYGHGTAFDAPQERLIVSHGFARDGRHNDTWALNLKTNRWTNITPEGAKPLNRCLHEMDYVAATNSVYLFGGCSSGFGPCPQGDLWSLDLDTQQWQLLSPAGETPSARENLSLVVDSETGNLILFGGKADAALNDLWIFDSKALQWQQIHSRGPSARKSHDAVWDALHHRVYLFGGNTGEGAVNDLWSLEL